jgi:hypothetical protein
VRIKLWLLAQPLASVAYQLVHLLWSMRPPMLQVRSSVHAPITACRMHLCDMWPRHPATHHAC